MGDMIPTILSSRVSEHTLRGMKVEPKRRYWATAWWGNRLTTRGASTRWGASLKALASVVVYRLTGNLRFI